MDVSQNKLPAKMADSKIGFTLKVDNSLNNKNLVGNLHTLVRIDAFLSSKVC